MNYATKMTAVAATATALLIAPIERIVSSLYQPNRPTLTGTDIGNVAGAAYAQDHTKLAASTKIPGTQYKTVDAMLTGTPFKIVDVDGYKREIQSNARVAAFFYRNDMPQNADGNLAKVYQEIFKENPGSFGNVTFLALKLEQGREDVYRSIGFEVTPSTLYFLNGKVVGHNRKGPMNEKEHSDAKRLLLSNIGKLSAYVVSSK